MLADDVDDGRADLQVERLRVVALGLDQARHAPAAQGARQLAQAAGVGHRPPGQRLVGLLQFGQFHRDHALVLDQALAHRLVVALAQHQQQQGFGQRHRNALAMHGQGDDVAVVRVAFQADAQRRQRGDEVVKVVLDQVVGQARVAVGRVQHLLHCQAVGGALEVLHRVQAVGLLAQRVPAAFHAGFRGDGPARSTTKRGARR